jgi:hypothetical protein
MRFKYNILKYYFVSLKSVIYLIAFRRIFIFFPRNFFKLRGNLGKKLICLNIIRISTSFEFMYGFPYKISEYLSVLFQVLAGYKY